MRKLWTYAVIAALTGMVSSCLSDDNNYDYKQINMVQRAMDNFENLALSYSVVQGEELTLAPTFKFTIDSINPDISYEWYLDQKLLAGETNATYTFKSDKSGTYQVTFSVKDNKTDVRFSKSTTIKVRTVFQRGWVILSNDNGRSVLHFIVPASYKYQMNYNGTTFMRDSLVYHDIKRDIVPNLGNNPTGLMSNIGDMDYSGEWGIEVYDELVVKQDKWAELNGNTLEREVYTYQEFGKDLPADFSPREAAMTYSAKAILDNNGLIYWENKGDVSDFHAGFYTSVGLNNNTLFSRLFQAYKLNSGHTNVMLALTKEDNSFVGILDLAFNFGSTAMNENSARSSGNVLAIAEDSEDGINHFANIAKKVVDAQPAPYDSRNDVTSAVPFWVALLKDEDANNYELRYFKLAANHNYVNCTDYYENSLGAISDYRDMTVFYNKRYAVIADGNQLYYYQFGWDKSGTAYKGQLMPLGEPFQTDIKSLSSADIGNNVYVQKFPYSGQLGVALEDGSFYIFGVDETRDSEGVCTAVARKQLYPNEKTSEQNKKFGTIVDVLYKIGRSMDYIIYEF